MGFVSINDVEWSDRDYSHKLKDRSMYSKIVGINMVLSVLAVIFLALTGETYATALSFLLLLLKAFLYMKGRKSV